MFQSILYAVLVALPASAMALNICKLLETQMPGLVSYPISGLYNSSLATYYSAQEREINPACIFKPTSTSEVSKFVQAVTANRGTRFAVRGGGHTLFSGAANIDNGITVDMRSMKSVTLSRDHKVAQIGAGSIFSDVYPQLTGYNLTVMGARVPGIGVGGFVTGGGITFLSRKYGFSCDNIYGYELVLASGKIIYVTENSYPDLWVALKGGSNNFGIITRFDVATFPSDRMLYNLLQYNYTDSVLEAQARAFSNFMKPANYDPEAMMGLFLDYTGGVLSVNNALWYTKPVASPAVYKAFTKIPNTPIVSEIVPVADVVTKFGEIIPAIENRAFQLTFSFQNPEADVYMKLFKIWESGIEEITDVKGLFIEFLTQPQPVTNGTNMFNLKPGKTDYVNIDMTATYNDKADDQLIVRVMNKIVNSQRALLKSNGLLIDFVYLNYADISQNVYQSWGGNSVAKFRAASKKYDPRGVFQIMVPGGYKIPK
ncbi:Glucooligosaccharide oxidase [Nemania serpens]|nr:Glucooligosaccharide oxidase [Nemania serpens]